MEFGQTSNSSKVNDSSKRKFIVLVLDYDLQIIDFFFYYLSILMRGIVFLCFCFDNNNNKLP